MAVHAVSDGTFWAAAERLNGTTFLVRYENGSFDEEIETEGLVSHFYEEGGTLYGLQSSNEPDPKVWRNEGSTWVEVADFWDSVPADLGGEPAGFDGFQVDQDGRLFVGVFNRGRVLGLLRTDDGSYEDLCAGLPASRYSAYWADGQIVDGRGRFMTRTAAPCMWSNEIPNDVWEYAVANGGDEIDAPALEGLRIIRNINGVITGTDGQNVFTREGSGWTKTVPAFSQGIGFIAGTNGSVYFSVTGSESSLAVYDDGQEVATVSPDGGPGVSFQIRGVDWTNGFIVAVGANGGYVLPGSEGEPVADIEVTVAGADLTDLSEDAANAADGAFRIDVDNLGDALDGLSFVLTTTPPAQLVDGLEHFGGVFDTACAETDTMGVYECEVDTEFGNVPPESLEQFYLGIALYQGPVEYFNTVELSARVTGSAGESTDEDEAAAQFVFDENPEYTGGGDNNVDNNGTGDDGTSGAAGGNDDADGGCGNSTVAGRGSGAATLLLALLVGLLTRRRSRPRRLAKRDAPAER